MSKFNDEWLARIEDVKDRMAERLKEYGFEVDESHIYTERVGDRLDNVDVDIVGEFTGLDKFCLTFASGSVIAACLKDYPYKDVVTFIHNIKKITVDTGRINAIEIFGTPMEEPTLLYAWSGLDFYEVFKGDEEEKEIRELFNYYASIVSEKLNNWAKNIRKEYCIEVEKEYWKLMDEYQTEKDRNGDIFK